MSSILNKTTGAAYVAIDLWLAPVMATADWSVLELEALKQQFVTGIASKYQAQEYPWVFWDPSACFEPGATCEGLNPDSSYGYVQFSQRGLQAARLEETDALVLIMETPPPMRYFGLTSYINTRYYDGLFGRTGLVFVSESLGDSVNITNIATTGSATPGENVTTQLSVFVVTADRLSYAQIKNQFLSLGFPEYAINQIALPINAVPLHMGTALTSDTFDVFLRLSYPEDPNQMQDYIDRAPIKALLLSPVYTRRGYALPGPIATEPGSGTSELPDLETARDQLFDDLKARYVLAYEPLEIAVKLKQSTNYICVWLGVTCNFDNPDALYTTDLQAYIPESWEEKILIVGVNHVDTDKASYISHSVVNTEHLAGVIAVNDDWLRGTALLAAGITDPDDPRYDTYSKIYAFTISYDCTGEAACVVIPEPTESDKVGVEFGMEMNIATRYYLDPATGTRPSIAEVIPHRVLVLKKK